MKALILAGGFGTRLKDVVNDVPKPMATVLDKPFLEHQISLLKEQGITEIILAVHHMSDTVKSYFGNGHGIGVEITYSEEDTPLGTAGAIKKAQPYLDSPFLVLNGDSYADVIIRDLVDFHTRNKSSMTIALTKVKDSSNFGNVVLEGNLIVDFVEKMDSEEGLVSIGCYLFDPVIFDFIPSDVKVSLEQEVFPKLAKAKILHGYKHDGYFMDIGRPETYNQFKQDALKSICLREHSTVSEALRKMHKTWSGLLLVVDEKMRLMGVLTDRILQKFLFSGGSPGDPVRKAMVTDPIVAKTTDSRERINELIFSGTRRLPIVDEEGIVRGIEFRTEKIKTESFPVVRGKTPLRISFAGGGTDIPYFFEKYGGVVISATINKYCHGSIVKRADSKIVINSDIDDDIIFDSGREMKYDGKFDIIKAIVKIMKPDFGFELYLHNDLPPGRGLGSSASLAVLVTSLLSSIKGEHYDDYKIAEIAYKAEREELNIKGGWQDQYAAVTGGFSFMEFNADKNIIYPLRLKPEIVGEFNEHLTLCYVGGSHFSGDLHKQQEENFAMNESQMVEHLNELKQLALKTKDCLLTNDIGRIGVLLHESWQRKKLINNHVTNNVIDELYETGLKNGAYGGRLLGAGAGGYILFFHNPHKRNALKKALEKIGGQVMEFTFDFNGTSVNPVRHKN